MSCGMTFTYLILAWINWFMHLTTCHRWEQFIQFTCACKGICVGTWEGWKQHVLGACFEKGYQHVTRKGRWLFKVEKVCYVLLVIIIGEVSDYSETKDVSGIVAYRQEWCKHISEDKPKHTAITEWYFSKYPHTLDLCCRD